MVPQAGSQGFKTWACGRHFRPKTSLSKSCWFKLLTRLQEFIEVCFGSNEKTQENGLILRRFKNKTKYFCDFWPVWAYIHTIFQGTTSWIWWRCYLLVILVKGQTTVRLPFSFLFILGVRDFSPEWPQTHCVAKDGFEHLILHLPSAGITCIHYCVQ